MTQKQTDYDKALEDAKGRINDERHRWSMEDAVDFAFKEGCLFGARQQMEKQKAEKSTVTYDDIMRMVERDNKCANAALILSALSVILIIASALYQVFRTP